MTRALKVVVFDLGETLVDETGMWERAAVAAGVPAFTLMGVIGGLAARGESHHRVWDVLGVAPPDVAWTADELYPDALPCLRELEADGLRVAAVGNTSEQGAKALAASVDVLGSSEGWALEKPAPEFFARVVAEAGASVGETAYVGDRIDNDVRPARAAGLLAVHVRRGPWGYLQAGADEADVRVDSLVELPGALARV